MDRRGDGRGGPLAPLIAAVDRTGLPDVEAFDWHGHPALKVGGKGLVRVLDGDTFAFRCPAGAKAELLAADPDVFFVTPRYLRNESILLRGARATPDQIDATLIRAYRFVASRSHVELYDRSGVAEFGAPIDGPEGAIAAIVPVLDHLRLPGAVITADARRPGVAVGGKTLMWVRTPAVYAFHCSIEAKRMLVEAEPRIYFETSHYAGYPAVLVRRATAGPEELGIALVRAFRTVAPPQYQAAYAGERPRQQG